MKKLIALLIILLLPVIGFTESDYEESEYIQEWCGLESINGEAFYMVDDPIGANYVLCDCFYYDDPGYVDTNERWVDYEPTRYVVEIEFAENWADAVGIVLYNTYMLQAEPKIILIMENENDEIYLERLSVIAEEIGIEVETITHELLD